MSEPHACLKITFSDNLILSVQPLAMDPGDVSINIKDVVASCSVLLEIFRNYNIPAAMDFKGDISQFTMAKIDSTTAKDKCIYYHYHPDTRPNNEEGIETLN